MTANSKLALALVALATLLTLACWPWIGFSPTRPLAVASSDAHIETRRETTPAEREPPPLTSTREAAPIEESEPTPDEVAAWTQHPFVVSVTDHFAEPLANIAVRVRFESETGGFAGARFEGVTDEHGLCAIDLGRGRTGVAPWLAVEAVSPPRYRKDRVRVRATSDAAYLVLILTGGLEGTVRFADGSLPPDGTTLVVSSWLNPSVHDVARTTVRRGVFAFESGLFGSICADELRFAKAVAYPVTDWQPVVVIGGGLAQAGFVFQPPELVR